MNPFSKIPKKQKSTLEEYMKNREICSLADGESIRIRFGNKMKLWLYREKERTGKSVSQIVREAVSEHMK